MPQEPSPFNIDTDFDVRIDSKGRDPDYYSPTLRRYHRYLWSKRLPSGQQFELVDSVRGSYLVHSSDLGEFLLGSDSVIPTFSRWRSMAWLTSQLDQSQLSYFVYRASTIGSIIVFPSNRIDGKTTLNAARGFNSKIADRFDLTLECIRRFYVNEPSPLQDVLARYESFFALFKNFAGYTEFFLLNDLISTQGSVLFFTDFDDFGWRGTPRSIEEYQRYRESSLNFIEARNKRIRAFNLDPTRSPTPHRRTPGSGATHGSSSP